MANQIGEFLRSDLGMYLVGLPLVSGAIATGLMGTGVPMAAAGAVGLMGGALTIGTIRGLFGAETPGLTKRELGQAAGIAAILTAVAYAFGFFGEIPAMQALVKAADQTATQVANAGSQGFGGFLGILVMFFYGFSMMLGTITASEFVADIVSGMAGTKR